MRAHCGEATGPSTAVKSNARGNRPTNFRLRAQTCPALPLREYACVACHREPLAKPSHASRRVLRQPRGSGVESVPSRFRVACGADARLLTEALCAGASSAQSVSAAEVESIGRGTGLLCQLARVTLEYEPGAPAGPRTLVAKLAAEDADIRGMVGLFRFYEREVRFYEELASSLSIAVPRCHWSAYDQDSGDFVLLLEDLGALRAADQLAPGSADDARLVPPARQAARALVERPLTRPCLATAVDSEIKARLGPLCPGVAELPRASRRPPAAGSPRGGRAARLALDGPSRSWRTPRAPSATATSGSTISFSARRRQPPILLDWQIAGRGRRPYDSRTS